jgi:putative glutamine amidotransferase
MKTLIGVTVDTHRGSRIPTRVPGEQVLFMWDFYLNAITDQGAVPVLLPITDDKSTIQSIVARMDGILLAPGNFDVPPELFGETRKPWLGPVKNDISTFQCDLVKTAAKRDIPVLGICGGMQTINVAFGGTLYQDIKKERPGSREHSQKNRQDKTCHQVSVTAGSALQKAVDGRISKKPSRLRVNSTHHQAIRDVAGPLQSNCTAADGIVEGIESKAYRFLLGVQWHPELLYKRFNHQAKLFHSFVAAASKSS